MQASVAINRSWVTWHVQSNKGLDVKMGPRVCDSIVGQAWIWSTDEWSSKNKSIGFSVWQTAEKSNILHLFIGLKTQFHSDCWKLRSWAIHFGKNFPRPTKTGKIRKPNTRESQILSHGNCFLLGEVSATNAAVSCFTASQNNAWNKIRRHKKNANYSFFPVQFDSSLEKNSMCRSSGISAIWIMSGQLKLYHGQPKHLTAFAMDKIYGALSPDNFTYWRLFQWGTFTVIFTVQGHWMYM